MPAQMVRRSRIDIVEVVILESPRLQTYSALPLSTRKVEIGVKGTKKFAIDTILHSRILVNAGTMSTEIRTIVGSPCSSYRIVTTYSIVVDQIPQQVVSIEPIGETFGKMTIAVPCRYMEKIEIPARPDLSPKIPFRNVAFTFTKPFGKILS